jgi:hypothetical protein
MEEVKIHYIFSRYVLSDSIFANRKLKCSIGSALKIFWNYFYYETVDKGRFRQKHIILTFSIGGFDTQSEKAYYFCTRTALK